MAELIQLALKNFLKDWSVFKDRFYTQKNLIISIGSDHRGYEKKGIFIEFLESKGYSTIDSGTNSDERCDHPNYAIQTAELVALGRADFGILFCSSGHGMIVAANKVPMVRAVMPVNVDHAHLSRLHNNANVLVLGADYMDLDLMKSVTEEWLNTPFAGEHYQQRINLISDYESGLYSE